MHFEAKIEWTYRCNWRPWWSEVGDAHRGRDRVKSEMQLAAIIEQVWRCAVRPWLIEIVGVLGRCQSGGGQSGGGQSGGGQPGGGQSGGGGSGWRRDGSWDSIYWLTQYCGSVENWVRPGPPGDARWDWLWAGDSRAWGDAELSACCTWCYLMIMALTDSAGWLNFVFLGEGRVQDEMER